MKLFVSPAHSSLLLTIGTISCRIWIWRLGVYFVADEFNVGLNVDSKPLCFFTIDPSTHGEVTPTAPTRALQLEPTAWVRVALEVPKKAPTKVRATQILGRFTNELRDGVGCYVGI